MNHLPVQYLIGGTEKLSDAAWALNAKTDAEDETLWLPLVVHLQDTAAVMEYLLWHWLPEAGYSVFSAVLLSPLTEFHAQIH